MNYSIKTVLFPTGERFPMFIESSTGIPDYWITIYSMTQLRSKGLAVNTIAQNLRHLLILKFFLKKHYSEEINLDKRLSEGKILHLHEIETLCDICKLPYKNLTDENTSLPLETTISLKSIEKFRSKNPLKNIHTVDSDTTANRIRVIRDYLVWLSNNFLFRTPDFGLKTLSLNDSIKLVKSTLTARIPKSGHDSQIHGRKGLATNELKLLFSIVNKNSNTNPWKSEFSRARNELIVSWLYEFGLRRGELLSIKVSDIDFQSETFLVLRRPDDPDDPRLNQPLVKTRERKLPIPKKILGLTLDYVLGLRGTLPEAQYHEFLFVADKSGKPMSLDSVNKIFSKIKESNQDLPRDLSPHILRHSWNDNFSSLMENKNIPEEKEKKMRSYLMGWSDTSNSASQYTKRYVQEKANQVLLEMGNKMLGDKTDNGDKK